MSRILVADDNSNIHRAISLALKDSGVEVVAVGNGEAAVRKLPELKPDLVLADIFMPVRSGYEVCEFVKNDPRFAEIPVVLLVGAFDPFDEREAQRVKADAILKKPFMPPDALVRTVIDLLERTAAKRAPVSVQVEQKSAESSVASAASGKPAAEYSDASPEEFTAPRAALEWNSSEQPVAFGALLETPGEADELVVTSQRDPNLGEPAFWAPPQEQEHAIEEVKPSEEKTEELAIGDVEDSEQWQLSQLLEPFPGDSHGMPAVESAAHQADALPEVPAFPAPVGEVVVPAEASQTEALALLEPTTTLELTQGESLAALSEANIVTELPAAGALSELPAMASLEPQQIEAAEVPLADLNDFAWPNVTEQPLQPMVHEQPEAEAKTAELAPLATLAPFLARLTESAASASEHKSDFDFGPLPSFKSEPAEQAIATLDAPRAVATLDPDATVQLDAAAVETVVQRVIERMQPQIIDLVTRELLRPVVEALVQRELEKK